jgi:GT2 family glycosyltransferase
MASNHRRHLIYEEMVRRLLGNVARRMRFSTPRLDIEAGEDTLGNLTLQLDLEAIRPFFEPEHYRELLFQNGIVIAEQDDEALIRHYITVGHALGLDPARDFSTDAYNLTYADVALSGMNAFVHYVRFGQDEGREKRPFSRSELDYSKRIIDDKFYLYSYHELAGRVSSPAAHFAAFGWKEGRSPNPYSHIKFVIAKYPEAGSSLGALLRTLTESIYHNGLMQRPATLAEIVAAVRDHNDDFLSDVFGFDVAKYSSEQHDVVARWSGHPIEHLFYDGLRQNRLRAGKYLHPFLTPTGFYENDFEMLSDSRAPLGPLNFERLQSSPGEYKLSGDVPALSLYVGIVLYGNTRDELARLFDSLLLSSEGLGCEICIHVQDNSEDPLDLSWLDAVSGPLQIVLQHEPTNPGFAKSHNHLMELGFSQGFSHYVGLNPDGFLFPDSLSQLVVFAKSRPKPAIIQLELEPLTHPKWHHPLTGETHWVSGAAFMIDHEAYDRTQGFDPKFPMYCEDVDLSFRAMQNDVHLFVSPESRFYHDTTSRLFVTEDWRDRRMMVGGWYLCEKWGHPARANKIKADLIRRGFDLAELPIRPEKTAEISEKVQQLLTLERFAVSRFWES